MRVGIGEVRQADETQRLVHARAALQSACFQAKRCVPADGAPRVECRVLEYEHARRMWGDDPRAVDQQRAGRWRFQAGNQTEQSGLAAAARAEHCNELSRLDAEADVVQHGQL